MTVFHRKHSLRAQFLEEKTQNLQLVICPKSTLESPHEQSNCLSNCGLVDGRISASEKDLCKFHIVFWESHKILRSLPITYFWPRTTDTQWRHKSKHTCQKFKNIHLAIYPIFLLNDDNMLGEHKGRERNVVYRRLFQKIHILYFDGRKFWIWGTLVHIINIFIKLNFHSASNKGIDLQKKSKSVHGIKSTM